MKKQNYFFIAIVIIGMAINSHAMAKTNKVCDDPVKAVLKIMDCIEKKNSFCAGGGYASNFKKFHNEIDTKSTVPGRLFWFSTFFFVSFDLDIDHAVKVADNQVSLRYVEEVRFKDGDVFYQNEHALVTVNSRCKMTLWDQYGDDQEQIAVEEKADELKPF